MQRTVIRTIQPSFNLPIQSNLSLKSNKVAFKEDCVVNDGDDENNDDGSGVDGEPNGDFIIGLADDSDDNEELFIFDNLRACTSHKKICACINFTNKNTSTKNENKTKKN